MAKVTHGPAIADLRGKVGGIVANRNRGGNFVRALSLSAGGVGPHNLLSASHLDTFPATPPARGSLITGQDVATKWKELLLGAAGKYLKTDGIDALWADLPAPPYPGAGSIALSQHAQPASLNLSTEGTYDWMTPCGQTTTPRQQIPANNHRKILGGWLSIGFDWVSEGGILYTQASTIKLSTNANDDTGGGPMTNFQTDQGLYTNSDSLTGFGFCFRAPAGVTPRTLKLYCSCFSAVITMKCRASDASFADTSDTFDSGAGAVGLVQWDITYNTGRDGKDMLVQVLLTTNRHSSPHIKMSAITLA